MSRPTWDQYFMKIAAVTAERSTCVRVPDGVGCVITRDHVVLAMGYCGSVRGQKHCTEVGCLIDAQTHGCVRTVHAEQNALLHARTDLRGATAYVTLSPCWACARLLIQAGIVRIIYRDEYRSGVYELMKLADEASVIVERLR